MADNQIRVARLDVPDILPSGDADDPAKGEMCNEI
jgi:hypothetical protein